MANGLMVYGKAKSLRKDQGFSSGFKARLSIQGWTLDAIAVQRASITVLTLDNPNLTLTPTLTLAAIRANSLTQTLRVRSIHLGHEYG